MKRRRWFISCVLLATAAGSAGAAKHESLSREFHETHALSTHGRVSLNNVHGDVRIMAWDRQEIRVDAVESAATQDQLDHAHIVVEAHADSVSIQTKYDQGTPGSNPARVAYTVMVPREARLDAITLINGELEISGVAGGVKASSVNGRVRGEKLAGEARLSTVNGSLEAMFERLDPAKAVALKSVNGNIVLSIPFDARAKLEASNVTGGIRNDFGLPVDRGQFVGSRLCGAIKGGGTRIELHNVNGSISILPVANGRRVKFT
jgi:DUF4097 and DUF4098 domain-containing protein YvlB